MQPFIKQLAAFLSIQACICGMCAWLGPSDGDEYIASTIDKETLLRDAPGQRLILLGGSNLAFGMDSPQIARQLGYHPVNMGVHAGFGLPFMLNQVASNELRSGDIVVVSMEYEHFGNLIEPDVILADLLAVELSHLRFVGWEQWGWCLDNGLTVLSYTARRAGRRALRLPAMDNATPPYCRSGFNAFGDLVCHWTMPPRRPLLAVKMEPGTPSLDGSIDRLNRFCELCEARGVKLFYAFPPIERSSFEESRNVIAKVAARIRERLTFPILNDPDEIALNENMFFDSCYHLTGEGAEYRTARLIADLRSAGLRSANRLAAPAIADMRLNQ